MPTAQTSKRVLIIDDQEVIRWLLGSALRDRGFEVETAGSGPDALARVQQQPPDAVVLDVVMPDMDGFEVLAALRSHPPTAATPVVVISAAVDPSFRPRARENGAVFLEKPFHWREVVRTVEAALSGGSPAAA